MGASSLGYTGEMTDPSGLVYLRARYYNPAVGIFTQPDPVQGVMGGRAIRWNPYPYVGGNPVNITDPSGEFFPLLVGAAVIGAVTAAAYNVAVEQGYGRGGRNSNGHENILDLVGNAVECADFNQAVERAAQGAVIALATAGAAKASIAAFRHLAPVATATASQLYRFSADSVSRALDWANNTWQNVQGQVQQWLGTGSTTEITGWQLPESGGGAVINGRWYTEHALERMAPNTPQIMAQLEQRAMQRANELGLTPGTSEFWRWWRRHGPIPRGIPPSVVEAEIANPGSTNVNVILNDRGDVITVIGRSLR